MINTIYLDFGRSYIKRHLELLSFFFPYLKEIGFAKFFSPTCPELGGELHFEQQKKPSLTLSTLSDKGLKNGPVV